MKKDIHPEMNPVCFKDISTGKKFLTRAALKSNETEEIDGVEYHVVECTVTSDSHPVYTGEKRIMDTAGRVEKFKQRYQRKKK